MASALPLGRWSGPKNGQELAAAINPFGSVAGRDHHVVVAATKKPGTGAVSFPLCAGPLSLRCGSCVCAWFLSRVPERTAGGARQPSRDNSSLPAREAAG
jgi:hypothetical protein